MDAGDVKLAEGCCASKAYYVRSTKTCMGLTQTTCALVDIVLDEHASGVLHIVVDNTSTKYEVQSNSTTFRAANNFQ